MVGSLYRYALPPLFHSACVRRSPCSSNRQSEPWSSGTSAPCMYLLLPLGSTCCIWETRHRVCTLQFSCILAAPEYATYDCDRVYFWESFRHLISTLTLTRISRSLWRHICRRCVLISIYTRYFISLHPAYTLHSYLWALRLYQVTHTLIERARVIYIYPHICRVTDLPLLTWSPRLPHSLSHAPLSYILLHMIY